jgi:hypothetical protein
VCECGLRVREERWDEERATSSSRPPPPWEISLTTFDGCNSVLGPFDTKSVG